MIVIYFLVFAWKSVFRLDTVLRGRKGSWIKGEWIH
nr:MAG TPA: hypothetical protein [Caudoviricetes sp.]